MLATPITLADFVVGHTFDGIPSAYLTITPAGGVPAPPASPLDKVEMVWVKEGCPTETFTLTTEGLNPAIEITNAATWYFAIPEAILPLATPGRWKWLISGYAVDTSIVYPIFIGQVTVKPAP